MDDSAVFHRDTLDDAHISAFPADRPWLFETDDGITWFADEHAACEAQRNWRKAHGFDPITGEAA